MTLNVTAIILRQEDWRERDVLITMYTRESGKMEALAKGLRRIESKLAGHLEPLTTAEVFIVRGRNWPIIAGSHIENSRRGLRTELNRLIMAGTIARLVSWLTPLESADERIYSLLDKTLTILSDKDIGSPYGELLAGLFVWKIMALSGYHPELKNCLRCRRRSFLKPMCLDARRGGIVHRLCADKAGDKLPPISAAAVKGLSYMTNAPIEHALRLRGNKQSITEIITAVSRLAEERYDLPMRFKALSYKIAVG